MVELLPCPFCGGSEMFISSNQADLEFVGCDTCGCEGPNGDGEEAIAAWNTRAALKENPDG